MTDAKYPISGSIRIWWAPANGLAKPAAPTAAEIAAAIDISDSISWNDKDFGIQASNTVSDPAITAKGNTQNRGAAQFGGSLSFYYPGKFNDNSNKHSLVWDALHDPGTLGYLIVRVDGLELATTAGTASQPGTAIASGDLVNVYKVETGGYSEEITGEEAFRYTISFLPKGFVKTLAVVRANATAVKPIITGASTATVGDEIVLSATLNGRKYTRGVKWTTTTPTLASVSPNGVVSVTAAGTVSVVATDPATGEQSAPFTITAT